MNNENLPFMYYKHKEIMTRDNDNYEWFIV